MLPITIPVNVVTCDGQNKAAQHQHPLVAACRLQSPAVRQQPRQRRLARLGSRRAAEQASSPVRSRTRTTRRSTFRPGSTSMQTGNVNGGGGTCDGEGTGLGGRRDSRIQRTDRLHPNVRRHVRRRAEPQPGGSCRRTTAARPNELDGGNGNNLWYRFPSLAYFELCDPSIPECNGAQGAYMQGNNRDECESGGNGATSCLVGQFVDILGSGTVGSGVGGGTGPGQGARGAVDQIEPALAAGRQEQDRRRRAERRGVSVWG